MGEMRLFYAVREKAYFDHSKRATDINRLSILHTKV